MKNLVIIPAYNEEASILKTVNDIRENAPLFDYIIINDCSNDSTLEVCRKNHLNVISLPVNLGIGGAVQTGYMYALSKGYDTAIQFDGDGQHSARYLERMLDEMQTQDADMVIGSRFIENEGFQSSKIRRIGIRFFEFYIRLLTGKNITDPTSGMRLVKRDIIRYFAKNYPKDYPEPETVVDCISHGMKVVEVPVQMNERTEGTSSISARRSVYYMIKVTIAMALARFR